MNTRLTDHLYPSSFINTIVPDGLICKYYAPHFWGMQQDLPHSLHPQTQPPLVDKLSLSPPPGEKDIHRSKPENTRTETCEVKTKAKVYHHQKTAWYLHAATDFLRVESHLEEFHIDSPFPLK